MENKINRQSMLKDPNIKAKLDNLDSSSKGLDIDYLTLKAESLDDTFKIWTKK